jgi:hypothetical protein
MDFVHKQDSARLSCPRSAVSFLERTPGASNVHGAVERRHAADPALATAVSHPAEFAPASLWTTMKNDAK